MRKTTERRITRLVLATGISSVVTQLVTIREFMVQLHGNEFVIALILFNWLILGGTGTFIARWVTPRHLPVETGPLGWFSLGLACLPTVQIFAVRMLRDLFFVHGTTPGFYPSLAYTGLTLAPYTLLLGFVLPYSLYVIRREEPAYPGTRIYIVDNLGDVAGGCLFSFLLVYLCTPLQALLIANLPLLGAALTLLVGRRRRRPAAVGGAALVLAALLAGVWLEPASLAPREGSLVYYRESRYGRVEVHQDREQFTLFQNGVPVSNSQNTALAEEIVHYPLAQLDRPQDILLLSTAGGIMAELAKYRPRSVDCVELDPAVTAAQLRFGLTTEIPGLNLIHQDARRYLKTSHQTYDAIIFNLPEPDTFQTNRFFTEQFFATVKDHLTPGGVLSFAMKGFDNYLSEPQRRKLSSLYNTVKDHFAHVLLLPGQKVFFLCRDAPLHIDIPLRLSRRGIETLFIRSYYSGDLTGERIARLNALMDPTAPKNRDEFPRLVDLMFSQWFARFATSPVAFAAAVGILLLFYLARISREEYVLFSTGCMVMGSEILVIFAFQIFAGYLYVQIGLIVTVFLAGLLPGAWLGQRLCRPGGYRFLRLADGLLIVLTGLWVLALHIGGERLPLGFFLGFGFGCALLCGLQFPLALQLQGGGNPAVARIFSADLIGAACGTLVTSTVLIPRFGIYGAATGLIVLKLASFGWLSRKGHAKVEPTTFSVR